MIIQRARNAVLGILHLSMDNQQKKEHLMKSGIETAYANQYIEFLMRALRANLRFFEGNS
jgi:hypothetical protein